MPKHDSLIIDIPAIKESVFSFLNSPLLFLAILAGFLGLSYHAYQRIPRIVVPAAKQAGYSTKEAAAMNQFVGFKIKEYHEDIVAYRQDLAVINHARPESVYAK